MRHSHMIICFFIFSTLLIEGTSLCSPPASCVTSSSYYSQARSPRRALRTHPTREHETATPKVSDDRRQHSIDNGGHDSVEPMKIGDDAVDNDELVYHIDYHGVTTHPAPTPKHPGHRI
ncbi:hypothetical protein RND81_08G019200 [Saponaria officinalis]|uniref:Secreted protein n=1 Tax=Saponaria officinalis TaxID=3572 RepID=A0AAW1J2X0_SAPOF